MMAAMIWLLALTAALAGPQASTSPAPSPAQAQQPRQLFLFLYRPGPAWRAGVPMSGQDLRAHAAYHAGLVREGRSPAAGGYTDRDGGMAIIRAADLSEAQAMLAADPAIRSGVFVAEIRPWAPRFHGEAPLVEPRP